MVKENVTTITLTGEEVPVKFSAGYPFYWVNNLGDSEVYASSSPNITADADGVCAVPSGGSVRLGAGSPANTIYLQGTGRVQIYASGNAHCPFKMARKGGGKANPHIYNHGGVVGLNGDVFHIDRSKYDIYKLIQTNTQWGGAGTKDMVLDDNSLTINHSSNQMWYIPVLISTKGYKYLCVDAEVPSGTNGKWNVSTFGAIKKLNGANPPDMFVSYRFTDSYIDEPYNYKFPRQVVKIDVSNYDGICIGAHNCECLFKIYSIFLSNE
ncbi:MAG: hypothetical protein J6C96_03840 [Oscillospiraceae bacterium]|nr:hypothetical protein [Oscillospiraceae bacterium]